MWTVLLTVSQKLSSDVLFSETTQYSYLTSEIIRKLRVVKNNFLKTWQNDWSRPLRVFVMVFYIQILYAVF